MSLMDAIFGARPEYDPDTDPMAIPDERESKDQAFHVRQDARRYAAVMHTVTGVAGQQQGTQRLLIVIIALLIANKAIDVSFFTGLFTP